MKYSFISAVCSIALSKSTDSGLISAAGNLQMEVPFNSGKRKYRLNFDSFLMKIQATALE
jgi:hypothetical protein